MSGKLTYPESAPLSTVAVAAIAAVIAIGLRTAVVYLFQRDGTPMQQLVAAKRADADPAPHRDIQYHRPQCCRRSRSSARDTPGRRCDVAAEYCRHRLPFRHGLP